MLIVDDMKMNREILKVLFCKDYEVMEAEDGEEALTILQGCQGNIDIVLLDLMLPDMTGFEILEKRKNIEYFQDVPVVVITSSDHVEDQVKAFELGANDYITKPFIPEVVLSRINNVMESSKHMIYIEMEAQKMKAISEMDQMTGLYNKITAENAIDEILRSSEDQLEVLMIIDIDNFKTVNDVQGHQEGDRVIKTVANLITHHFRKTDIVGRIGGDEFCVMMVDVPDMNIVYSKVNELIQIMRYKPKLDIPEYVTLSIGLATNERKKTTQEVLFKKADEALYAAKKAGKAQYQEYGIEPVKFKQDKRSTVILLCKERGVSNIVHALMPSKIRVIDVTEIDELDELTEKDRKKVKFIYADVSVIDGDADIFWKRLNENDWIRPDTVFSICEEGNVAQYLAALQNGVGDMLTKPIDVDTFKRRLNRQLEKLNLV